MPALNVTFLNPSAAALEVCEASCAQLGLRLDVVQADDAPAIKHALQSDAPVLLSPSAQTASLYSEAIGGAGQSQTRILEVHSDNIFTAANIAPLNCKGANIGLVIGWGLGGYSIALRSLAPNKSAPVKSAPKSVLIINGPNLNMLGTREPHIYGHDSLEDVNQICETLAADNGAIISCRQSNHEGQIVDWIQQARGAFDGLIINAGAYTHTSIAIHDALRAYEGFKAELHISNPHTREAFRHLSFISPAVDTVTAGLGVSGYETVLQAVLDRLS